MRERGIKKWLAYKSLTSQEEYLNSMRQEKARVEKPLISESVAENIDNLLRNYTGERVIVTFYLANKVRTTEGIISRIDGVYKILGINNMFISFKDVLNIEAV